MAATTVGEVSQPENEGEGTLNPVPGLMRKAANAPWVFISSLQVPTSPDKDPGSLSIIISNDFRVAK